MKKEGTERQITAIKQLRAKLNMNRTEFSKEIDDYNQAAVSFETKIDGNNMKLVCFSYATLKDGSTIYNSYKITGKQTISTLKVQRGDFTAANRIPWQIVGGAVANVNLNLIKSIRSCCIL